VVGEVDKSGARFMTSQHWRLHQIRPEATSAANVSRRLETYSQRAEPPSEMLVPFPDGPLTLVPALVQR
jgi:hypothetical protein